MDTVLNTVLIVPTMLLTLLVFGAVLRRLLGVRVSLVRTLLAALFALAIAGPLIEGMLPSPTETDTGTAFLVVLVAVCCASLLGMIVLVIAEVIIPDGSLPGPIELWRGGRTRINRTRRYSQILSIALRHGLGRFLRGQRHSGLESASARRQLARSLRRALDEGGVTFVKLGQQLSTRRDLIPVEFAEELAQLQDQAAPVPWDEIATTLTRELGQPVDDVFVALDPQPLAAASVAQVHAGRLPGGAEVVVKVQRPGIAHVVDRDLDILLRLARTLEARTEWGRAVGLTNLAAGFAEALREELDFSIERDNMRGLAATARPSDPRDPGPHAAHRVVHRARARDGSAGRDATWRCRTSPGRPRPGSPARCRDGPARRRPRPGARARAVPCRPAPGQRARRGRRHPRIAGLRVGRSARRHDPEGGRSAARRAGPLGLRGRQRCIARARRPTGRGRRA